MKKSKIQSKVRISQSLADHSDPMQIAFHSNKRILKVIHNFPQASQGFLGD